MGFQERIRKKIIISSALGILVIGVIVSLVSILPLYSRLKKEQENNLNHACKVRTMAVEEYLSRARGIALQITSRTQIRKKLEAYNSGNVRRKELVRFSAPKLTDAMNLSEEVAGISRLGPQGDLLVEVGLTLPTRLPWPVPSDGSSNVIIHGPSVLGGHSYLLIGAPIYGSSGSRAGTDIVLFRIDRLLRILGDYTGLGKTGETILGHEREDHVQLFSPTRTKIGPDSEQIPHDTPVGLALTKSIQKQSGITVAEITNGSRVILAYGPVQSVDWGIAVKMDAFELYSPVNRQIVLITSIIIILILIGSFGIILLVRPLTNALQQECLERRHVEEEKQILEFQLLQSQKLESVGRLAGGIAHDFNNLLSAIIGYSGLALRDLPDDHPARRQIQTIEEAGKKGAMLVRQLLAFSRKQVLRISIVNINDIVDNVSNMLSVVIGEDISLELKSAASLRNIMADPGQIEQILMNLAVNARDAMPAGGRLTIETANAELDDEYAQSHEGVKAGPYVLLTVTDTGEGMSQAIHDKIFEPFFTTKETGKGTGLGLATVYGIVKQHHGHIWFSSEQGAGTTFKIYFPVAQAEAMPLHQEEAVTTIRGSETIMVVDDEPGIRGLVADILKPLGYTILEASSGREALQVSDSYAKPIDLLLTDVILQGMNGRELADEFTFRRPEMKAVFMSGYTDNVIASHGVLEQEVYFIEKPLSRDVLVRTLRKALDA